MLASESFAFSPTMLAPSRMSAVFTGRLRTSANLCYLWVDLS